MPGRALRILYLIDDLSHLGGTETNLTRLLPRLMREGVEPYVITYALNTSEPAFTRMGCPVEVYPLRQIYTWNAATLGWRLHRFIRERGFDVVHCCFESSDLWGTPIARWAGVPAIVSSRRDMGIHRNRLQNAGYRVVSRVFDQVQAVSEEVRQWTIRNDRLAPNRVITIPNGIDIREMVATVDAAEVRRRYGLPGDASLITVVGNIRHIKGQDVLLEAAGRLRDSHSVAFVFAGKVLEQSYYDELQALAGAPALRGRVHFTGPVDDIPSLLAASSVFVLPSRSEGMSTALLESMACGCPVVATAVGGSPEVVRHNETGLLVPSEDVAALAAGLQELVDNPAQRERLGQAARRSIEASYSLDAVVTRLIEEYEKLVAARRPGKRVS